MKSPILPMIRIKAKPKACGTDTLVGVRTDRSVCATFSSFHADHCFFSRDVLRHGARLPWLRTVSITLSFEPLTMHQDSTF